MKLLDEISVVLYVEIGPETKGDSVLFNRIGQG